MENCSICNSDLEPDDCRGYLGSCEFALCVWCYSSLNMMFNDNTHEYAD